MPANDSFDVSNDEISLELSPERSNSNGSVTGVSVSFHDVIYDVDVRNGPMPCAKSTPKSILKNISGVMQPGLTGIMGPSGSGKTSLLDILAGRKDPNGIKSGQILFNGKRVSETAVRLSTGYVVQDDIVVGTLTVRENLLFSANLRLPSSKYSKNERANKVEKLIEDLGLSSCADTKVGNEFIRGISGGERKRVSIGMELIIDPPVLFLDEPTTGLDAYTASSIIELLNDLGKKGRTVILSIHQPRYSIFEMFDHLMVLSRGLVVYNGPCSESVGYFSSIGFPCPKFHNPGDYLLDVVNGQVQQTVKALTDASETENKNGETQQALSIEESSPVDEIEQKKIKAADQLSQLYAESQIAENERGKLKEVELLQKKEDVIFDQKITYPNSFFHQLRYVSSRTFYDLLRYPMSFLAPVMMNLLIGLIVGLIFFQLGLGINGVQDRAGVIYFVVTVNVVNNMSALELFIAKKKLFVYDYHSNYGGSKNYTRLVLLTLYNIQRSVSTNGHEKACGYYKTTAYFLSRIFADILPVRWMPLIPLSLLVYFMCGLQMEAGKYFFFLLTLGLITSSATTLAFALSSSFNSFSTASLGMMVVVMFMMLFGGFLVNIGSMLVWLEWIKWFSIFRYGLNSLLVNEMSGLVFITNSSYPGYDPTSDQPCFSNVTNSIIPGCTTGEQYLERQNIPYDTWGMWSNTVALAVMTIGFSTIALIKLHLTSIYK